MDKAYVEKAEKVVNSLKRDKYGKICLTTSQIRKFLSMVNSIHNKIQLLSVSGKILDETLSPEIQSDIQALKVKLIYQCGRDYKKNIVKDFVEKAGLLGMIDRIGDSRKAFDDFYGYIEAIVAYHKFEGGRD